MTATPFLIGAAEIAALERLRTKAVASPVDMAGLRERLRDPAHKRRHVRQMSEQSVELPFGFAVTFSIERNHPNGRTARHLSMSSPKADRVPHPAAVWMVAEVLGFTGNSTDAEANLTPPNCDAVWFEDLQGHGRAINVVQLLRAETGTA